MATNTVPANPFQKIALSCSGGGYRASTFHLGSMAYLNKLKYQDVPLLEHVKMISTVSGGTITGIVYTISKQNGESFEEFYTFLLQQLHTLDLVKEGIKKLNPDSVWKTPTKHKNLINAFAELYDDGFTKGTTFGHLTLAGTHLETVVFNSTEFSYAIDFRFRNKTASYTGNYYLKTTAQQAAEIKLADVMAASSCLTGGFEPIMWPQDFMHANSPNIKALHESGKPGVGLMDGGIYDNQGIDAILKYKAGNPEPYFDLVIISDVASPYMEAYKPTLEDKKEGINSLTVKDIKTKGASYSKIANVALVALVLFCGLLPAFWCYPSTICTGISIGLAFGFLMLLGVKALITWGIKKGLAWATGKVESVIPEFYRKKLANLDLDALSLHRVTPLLMDRINSLVSLLLNVFLKVVRRLNYQVLYTNENYKYRRISNLVKELTEADFTERKKRAEGDRVAPSATTPPIATGDAQIPAEAAIPVNTLPVKKGILTGNYAEDIGDELKKVADIASNFGTTLWFTEDDDLNDMLKKLVATGQCTMCYNLLVYLEKVIYTDDSEFNALAPDIQASVLATYEQCKLDWADFKVDPYFLFKELAKWKDQNTTALN